MDVVYNIGLFLVTIAYLACAGLTLSSKAKGTIRTTFIITYVSMIFWSGSYLYASLQTGGKHGFMWPAMESVFIGSLLLLLLAILDTSLHRFRDFIKSKYVIALLIGFVAFNIVISSAFITPENKFKLLITAELLASILGLILLEQIYRHAKQDNWAYKPMVLGLASIFIYHLVVMSTALLLNQMDSNYVAARPFVVAIAAPFLLLSMRRVNTWNLRVFVSREVVLHSSLLLFAGMYLLVMAMTGLFIQKTGKEWSGVVQVIFFAGALLVLAYIFISDSVRKYFRTFIQKHFYANQFDYREEWLKLTSILDRSTSNHDFYSVGLEGILQSLHYNKGFYAKMTHDNIEIVTKMPKQLSMEAKFELNVLAKKLAQNHWLIDVTEFGGREYIQEFQGYSVAHLAAFEVEFVVPIFIDERLHGVFVLSNDRSEKLKLNWEVRDYLTAVGSQIGSYFRFCEARAKLEENAKFAAFNRMSAFVVHDLKNVIAQIGMIVTNAEKYRHIPEFIDDTFETLGHTKERMDRMLSQLKEKQQQRGGHANLNLIELLQKTVAEFEGNLPKPQLVATEQEVLAKLDSDRMTSVIGHLIDNAQQATDDGGDLTVTVNQTADTINIIISDSGIGMTQEFIDNQLFKPFETTKGNAGMGVGVYEAKTYAEELGGLLTVESEVGKGTTFIMTLPLRNVSG